MTITKAVTFEHDGDEVTVHLPAKYHICAQCRGTGQSSAYLGAFTHERNDDMEMAALEYMEREEQDAAQERATLRMESGVYS